MKGNMSNGRYAKYTHYIMRKLIKILEVFIMEENKTLKGKVKKFWTEKRELIILGGAVVGTVIGSAIAINKINGSIEKQEDYEGATLDSVENVEPIDYGRDCIMTFTVEETGEVLGKVGCTESFVNDMSDLFISEEA